MASPDDILIEARQAYDSERELLIREVLDSAGEANEQFNIHTASKILARIDAYEMKMKLKMETGQMVMVRIILCLVVLELMTITSEM